ncbi:hypothetical protein L6R50_00330 [Myxococcota bacterium]|nr:hypothetical protein [Myxococcota bacterium]
MTFQSAPWRMGISRPTAVGGPGQAAVAKGPEEGVWAWWGARDVDLENVPDDPANVQEDRGLRDARWGPLRGV